MNLVAERIAIYGGTGRAVIDRALNFGGCVDRKMDVPFPSAPMTPLDNSEGV